MKTAMEKSSHAQTGARERTQKDAASLSGVSLFQTGIDSSPAVVAQRMQIENAFGNTIQRQPFEEDEEPLQGKFVALQRRPLEEEEEEPLQGKFTTGTAPVLQKKPTPNRTGLPDELKAGVENLSGLSLDDVRVHYNSSKPSELQALAYTQGNDIHVAPGQERHLPHEAWHVVQQMQGRVQSTMQTRGIAVNDNPGLEEEADMRGKEALQMKCAGCKKAATAEIMGKKALQMKCMGCEKAKPEDETLQAKSSNLRVIQLAKGDSCYCPGWEKNSPYHQLPEYRDQVGPGEQFTITQADDIYAENAKNSFAAPLGAKITSYYESDSKPHGALVKFSDINHLVAEVDHIVPQTHGGCNSVKNAQVISSWENGPANKGENYPYGGYSNYSVFDPTNNLWHRNKAAAIKAGATNAGNLP